MKKFVLLAASLILITVAVGGFIYSRGFYTGRTAAEAEKEQMPDVLLEQVYKDIEEVDFTIRSTLANKPFTVEGLGQNDYVPSFSSPIYIPHVVFDKYILAAPKSDACRIDVGGRLFISPQYPDEIEVISCRQVDGQKQVPVSVRLKWQYITEAEFSKWGFLLQMFSVEATSALADGRTEIYFGSPFGGKAVAVVQDKTLISLDMLFMPNVANYQVLKRVYASFEQIADSLTSQERESFGGIGWGRRSIPREYWTLEGYRIGGLKVYSLMYLDDYPIVKGELVTWADFPFYLTIWLQGKDKDMVESIKRDASASDRLKAEVEEVKGLYKVVITDKRIKQIIDEIKPLKEKTEQGEGKPTNS